MLGFARVLSVKGKVVAGSSLQQALASSAYAVSSVRLESGKPDHLEEHGFESTTIADILKSKGKKADGSWLFCKTDDTVYDAVKSFFCFARKGNILWSVFFSSAGLPHSLEDLTIQSNPFTHITSSARGCKMRSAQFYLHATLRRPRSLDPSFVILGPRLRKIAHLAI